MKIHLVITYNGKESEKEYMCIYMVYTHTHIYINHFAVYLKLTQHCKSTILQYIFLKKEITLDSSSRKRTQLFAWMHFIVRTWITREVLDLGKESGKDTHLIDKLCSKAFWEQLKCMVIQTLHSLCHPPAPSLTYTSKYQQKLTSQKAKCPPWVVGSWSEWVCWQEG